MAASMFPKTRLVFSMGLRPNSSQILRNVSFKSPLSLDKIYPSSVVDITAKPTLPPESNTEFSGFIPLNEVKLTYSTSSGPGGQNGDKVNTKVDLRFHLATAKFIPERLRSKISVKYQSLITKDGFLVIKSERTRSQMLNQADCLDKLRFIIRDSETERRLPTEADETYIWRNHESAARERLRNKRIRSLKKHDRMDFT